MLVVVNVFPLLIYFPTPLVFQTTVAHHMQSLYLPSIALAGSSDVSCRARTFLLLLLLFVCQAELGAAGSTKRPTSCVLIAPPKAGFDYQKKFDKVVAEVKALTVSE